jgi:arylsulfatase A-like enzyme
MEVRLLTSRRDFLRGAALAPAVLGAAADTPPNVVFVICDQMRADALGALGGRNGRTPNLDRLASQGVVFENSFSNNPVCVPSRKSMWTSLYPHQHGSLTNRDGDLLELQNTALGYFKERGYRIGYAGKNHAFTKKAIGSIDMSSVRDREPFREYNAWVPPYWHCDSYWPAEQTYANLNTEDALRFLSVGDRTPFFLTVSYFDPHPPYMAPSEYTSRYTSRDMRLPEFIAPKNLSPRLDEYYRALRFDRVKDTDLTEAMRYYHAAIEWGVDRQVGRIVNELEKRQAMDNTIIVFTSDHGDFMGEQRIAGKGMFLTESLLHVPTIMRVPGMRQGRRSAGLVQGIDILPTLAEMTGGVRRPEWMGRSLRPCLTGGSNQDAGHAIVTSAGYGELSKEVQDEKSELHETSELPLHTRVMNENVKASHRTSMIRTREWKMILSETRAPELYRLNGGYIERENVAEGAQAAGVRRGLEQRLQQRWKW